MVVSLRMSSANAEVTLSTSALAEVVKMCRSWLGRVRVKRVYSGIKMNGFIRPRACPCRGASTRCGCEKVWPRGRWLVLRRWNSACLDKRRSLTSGMLDGVDANENMGIQAKERRVRVAFSVCGIIHGAKTIQPCLYAHRCRGVVCMGRILLKTITGTCANVRWGQRHDCPSNRLYFELLAKAEIRCPEAQTSACRCLFETEPNRHRGKTHEATHRNQPWGRCLVYSLLVVRLYANAERAV